MCIDLVVFPLMHIVGVVISKMFGRHIQTLRDVAAVEDGIEFGRLGYNVIIRAAKAGAPNRNREG